MMEGSGSRARGTRSTTQFESEYYEKQERTRDDSGVDLSADIERAKEDLVGESLV